MRIGIIGAGIGGLATALSLEAAGFRDITVHERADRIRGLGVGLNLLPHAIRELTELGLRDRVEALGVAPETLVYMNRFGQHIWSEPRGLAAGYRWPQLSVHRGQLQLALRDAVVECLGDVIRLGHRLVDVQGEDDGSETVRFATADGEITATYDLVIGADGIHSALRALRYPAEGAPPWSGLTLWRGVAEAPVLVDGRTMIMAGDGDQKFVAYPLGAPEDGRQRLNFIAEQRGTGPFESLKDRADWNRAVDPGPIAKLFADWRFEGLDVPAIIANAEEILEYPMVDRDALAQWTFGRTTLVGDAAHAMYPNGSNGGSQAILDARTLAFHLGTAARAGAAVDAGAAADRSAEGAAIDAALAGYEDARRPAMTALLAGTRATGPERVMLLAAERAPQGFARIDDVIPRSEREEIANAYKRAAGFAPSILNERASLGVGDPA
ncbi:FAD-dependent monooxygenase [Microbacterium azadirachtae]|uniref:3-hydroxybenzoate 6-hydroxylase 1 n=1 Tax=Microbacterium azadirachtae TaxID=582680 RepID=A0A0F0LKG2_9MICO|nr:FAD-dependent monooxygenase [Microbacterium azadirachtae]KJL33682.1 3-hydroxybenzoate 6-hydroxylase 1 [Microbacterium azadirachtae]